VSAAYQAVNWNRQKRIYDLWIALLAALYLALFVALNVVLHPSATAETILIRGLGTLALLMLHVILAIGPLCRLQPRFLPLLYNRRHLGVAMFGVALAHGMFSLVQFHALGDVNPAVSLLASNARFDSLAEFPFELLGFAALLILFAMAATSHDFWLHMLSPGIWKRMHMCVYAAYALLVAHVVLGALQSERSPVLAAALGTGLLSLFVLHVAAGWKEWRRDIPARSLEREGFSDACDFAGIPDNRAKVVTLGGERIAIFRHGDRVSALSNVCRHQNGPLGEGKIIGGCVTCPWHGYQYRPDTGMSPPPYTDQVEVFPAKIVDGRVWVRPVPVPTEELVTR
jgi:nitrite reductase/ring-hydroxylating ferredoxin subunit/DMSO/TMAO reductase YedYZ heme-binding membrane subunit